MNNDDIIKELKAHGGNFSVVARALGLDYHALKQKFPQTYEPLKTPVGPEPTNIKTLGKPALAEFVIAVKKAGQAWPEKYDAVIADARRKFDAGTHEMFQSNNEGWVVQYLIPHLVPQPRRQFFSSMIVMK